MMRYHEALSRCLEAIAEGRNLDEVIAGLPQRHHEALCQDATLTEAMRRHSGVLPPPSRDAEANAMSRLNAELSSQRATRETSRASGGFLGLPRFALAGLALAVLLIGASFLVAPNRGNDGTVEAAEFEGVVVANSDGSLTVQTLDTLEEVMVPLDAAVLDADGNPLELGAIEAGEVIFVRGNRDGKGPVRAEDIRRRLDGLQGWCDENAERCRQIAQNLKDAQERCQNNPEACRLLHDRATDVIARVTDVANLEDLKQRCRVGGGEDCLDITSFCRDHPDSCVRDVPDGPVTDRLDDARERIQQLENLCANRDTRACRQIAPLCDQHPALCSDAPVRPSR
jgi:hypothetical protein